MSAVFEDLIRRLGATVRAAELYAPTHPLVERTALDVAARRAAVFQFEVPAEGFQPGLYTCQVNIIDDVAARFALPRLALYVR